MRFPVSQITTLALFVHVTFGCCWHHGHACVPKRTGATTVAAVYHGHGHCESHGHEGEDPSDGTSYPSDNGSHEHQCQGSDCSFVLTETSRQQRCDGNFADCPWEWGVATTTPATLPQPTSFRGGHGDFYASAPLRAHLLFSVLLI